MTKVRNHGIFVFSNLATSLDGKIAPERGGLFHLGTPEDRRQMIRLRDEADAVLFGASTLRAWRRPCRASPGRDPQPLNVVLSSRLEGFSRRWPFFTDPGLRRLLIVSAEAPAARVREFSRGSEVLKLRKPSRARTIAAQVLEAMAERGVRRLLVEGGGSVMAEFARHDRIDEYHVTLTPRILGGSQAPTLVDGRGLLPRESLQLKLVQCRPVGDELYLIYRRTGKRG